MKHWNAARGVLREKEAAKAAWEGKTTVDLAVEAFQEGDNGDVENLKRLQRFRSSKRQELFDYSLNGGKYDALKVTVGSGYEEDDIPSDEDPDAALAKAHEGIDGEFGKADARHGGRLRRDKIKVRVAKEVRRR